MTFPKPLAFEQAQSSFSIYLPKELLGFFLNHISYQLINFMIVFYLTSMSSFMRDHNVLLHPFITIFTFPLATLSPPVSLLHQHEDLFIQVSSCDSLPFLIQALPLAALSTNKNSAISIVTACRSNFSTARLTPDQTKIWAWSPNGYLAVRSSFSPLSSASILKQCGQHYHPTYQSCSSLDVIFVLVFSFSPCLHRYAIARCWRVFL